MNSFVVHTGPAVTFTFQEEGPRIVYSDGSSSPLPAAALTRSRLLRDICESEGLAGQRASVELSSEQVYTWLAFIDPVDEHSLLFASDEHLITVLKVCVHISRSASAPSLCARNPASC
jgi:hypothetical protein